MFYFFKKDRKIGLRGFQQQIQSRKIWIWLFNLFFDQATLIFCKAWKVEMKNFDFAEAEHIIANSRNLFPTIKASEKNKIEMDFNQ